mmetsp:Transcript_28142/g.36876  ORF Transcript_28142/g.36876 Transcript_28142/m.36876 type:complete len:128 (+) Transcript_28142:129-512(+)|eukprot:CAMPEP_0117766516 /NCGR_PEP_ID=MMETSP0947-20121206/20918_1 /TAXON_ID=44440 /ORGANISM="Chattonella subsalsa, Strain CCMP2191" /LENGTH=127 /DNA_ID=CAMNT_0005589705 /DNA_START=58 /DNA_END=441 /DNA_ORIENTATION=+
MDHQAKHVDPKGVDPSVYYAHYGGSFGVSVTSGEKQKGSEESDQQYSWGKQEEFINHGLNLWEQQRQNWLSQSTSSLLGSRCRDMDIDLVIDRIFSSSQQGKLPHALPLPQMIDILVDLWEAEGLYD